jgi:hypothetical protein
MKWCGVLLCLISACACWARTGNDSRQEAEYYVAAYARHYNSARGNSGRLTYQS